MVVLDLPKKMFTFENGAHSLFMEDQDIFCEFSEARFWFEKHVCNILNVVFSFKYENIYVKERARSLYQAKKPDPKI